jgi:anti-sigma factor RsiW
MNRDLELRLQAWVDGELPEGDADQIARMAVSDPEAQALIAELRMTKGFLASNELEHRLPESHDFHWSKIRREIERLDRQEAATAPSGSWLAAFGRMLAPVSGAVLVALVTLVSLNFFRPHEAGDTLAGMVEVENPSEHIGSISYRSQNENMFVVWLYDKEGEANAEAVSEMPEPVPDDLIIQ